MHLKSIGTGLLDLIYPPVCLLCGADVPCGALCSGCEAGFVKIGPPYCDRCGEPVSAGRIVCKRCEQGPGPAYDWAQAAFQYDGPMLKAVHRLKYDGRTALAAPLGELLSRSMDAETPLIDRRRDPALPAFDMVAPVPLHSGRMRQRGFNQAELLARVVAREHGIPLAADLIRRIKPTPTQTAMSREQRTVNMRGAFRVLDPDRVERKSVLIVDDVLTSTSTAREIAKTVAEAGASRVCVLALARSV